jgi:hypothetical protein
MSMILTVRAVRSASATKSIQLYPNSTNDFARQLIAKNINVNSYVGTTTLERWWRSTLIGLEHVDVDYAPTRNWSSTRENYLRNICGSAEMPTPQKAAETIRFVVGTCVDQHQALNCYKSVLHRHIAHTDGK